MNIILYNHDIKIKYNKDTVLLLDLSAVSGLLHRYGQREKQLKARGMYYNLEDTKVQDMKLVWLEAVVMIKDPCASN